MRGSWDQCVAPYEYVTHRVGDEVDVSEEEAARLIGGGTAVDADAEARDPYAGRADSVPLPPAPDLKKKPAREIPKKPRRAASKSEWVRYAEKIGVVTKRADGEDMEKSQLIVAVEDYLSKLED
ncbi:hypothetical protein CCICO_04395 [Corynebacterium ciconiae DSM 44920]|nr:hypothetical protein CCICO_04395 [Corynebacterium ciconiae DSM 44920]